MALILREWRSLQRRCHRALLTALRDSSTSDSQSITCAYTRCSDCKLSWLSALYGFIIASKRSREMARVARITAPSVPVISVGNVTFGATGKTPCVMLLTQIALQHSRARKRDKVPMLLTRVRRALCCPRHEHSRMLCNTDECFFHVLIGIW